MIRAMFVAGGFLSGLLLCALPVRSGYQGCAYPRADIEWATNTGLPPEYAAIEYLMDDSEHFHRFHFLHRVNIVACRSWNDFHQFVPFIHGEVIGALTLEHGTSIFITPRVEETGYAPTEFIRHELSHALLLQNSPMASRPQFRRCPWLYEGIAVLAANQKAYGTAADFVRRTRLEDLQPLFEPASFEHPGFDLRLAYRAWRYFLEDLIATRGREKFQILLARFMLHPSEVELSFGELYRQPLTVAIANFERKVRNGQWKPHRGSAN